MAHLRPVNSTSPEACEKEAQTVKTNRMAILSAALGIVAVAIEALGVFLVVWDALCRMTRDCQVPDAALNATILAAFLLPASALITGIVARRQIAHSQGTQKGRIGVLAGIAFGGLVLAGNVLLACGPLLGFLTTPRVH